MSQSAQANFENDGRSYWAEDHMTESERREFEAWLDGVYWSARELSWEKEF